MIIGWTGLPLVTRMKKLVLALSVASALRAVDKEYATKASILEIAHEKHVENHATTAKFENFVYGLAEKAVAGNYTMDDTTKEAVDIIKTYFETLHNHSLESHAADQENVDAAYDAIEGCTSDTQTTRTDAEGLLGTAGTDRNEHNRCRARQVIADDNKTRECAFYWNYRNTDAVKTALGCKWPSATEACLRDSFPTVKELHRLYKLCEAMGGFSDAPVPDEGQSFDNMYDIRNLAAACDSAQSKFERSFCSYASKADDGCNTETSCREREIAARNALHARVRVSEEGRKVDKTVSVRITCLLTIFDLADGDKLDKFNECKATVVNTSIFNITYHGIPPASYGGVACTAVTAPCADAWVTHEYPPQPWYEHVQPATCTPCTQPQATPQWRTIYSKGNFGDVTKDANTFNAIARQSTLGIVRRECEDCGNGHKDIYFRRKTAPAAYNFYNELLGTWHDSGFHQDFDLYSTYADAVADQSPWQFCNGNDPEVGFPRDCGTTSKTNYQWTTIGQKHSAKSRKHYRYSVLEAPSTTAR